MNNIFDPNKQAKVTCEEPEELLVQDDPMADEYFESHGWPGDGSGEDDLADMNANEADDYRNEGCEDCGE